jgi:DNA-binding MarR family transcriptional regulator
MARRISAEAGEIADRVHSAAIHLLRKLRREDAASGLNAPRLSALSVVVFAGPLTLGQLAEAEQVRPPTMTRIVDALEAQGLATRGKSATDGRSIRIAATPAGRNLLLRGRARRVSALARQIAALTVRERATLIQAVETLQKVVAKI